MNPVDLRLYGIVDPEHAEGRDLGALARAAVAGGCTLIQYRDKFSPTRTMIERGHALRAALAGTGVPLLINDRVDVALAVGADGVHVGQEDMHASDARRLLGPRALIGLTLKTAAQADELYRLPVDYACIGGIFTTTSKHNADPPIGLDGLNRIAFRARLAGGKLPVAAIAGINRGNAEPVIAAGADGIAVISGLFGVDNVEDAARNLRAAVDRARAARGLSL